VTKERAAPPTEGHGPKSEATDQSNFGRENRRSAASKQESEFDDLTKRSFVEWRREHYRNRPIKPLPNCADWATYGAIAEFAETASEIADALVWSAWQHDDRRRCALYARQLAAVTRTILCTVAELGKGAKP
jgi:hypothetical protein